MKSIPFTVVETWKGCWGPMLKEKTPRLAWEMASFRRMLTGDCRLPEHVDQQGVMAGQDAGPTKEQINPAGWHSIQVMYPKISFHFNIIKKLFPFLEMFS